MNIFLLFLSLSSTSSSTSWASLVDKVFYGQDDRVLVRELNQQTQKKYITSSNAVMAQVNAWRLSPPKDGLVSMMVTNFQHSFKVCSEESFLDEPVVASCSAFLIAPDLILTAGHCVESNLDCKSNKWILDYNEALDFSPPYSSMNFPEDKIYSCKELVSSAVNVRFDYALVRLDRKVTDRAPLALNLSGHLEANASLYVVGHPLGLPKMLAPNATVRRNINDNYFVINSDTFHGNSGSPVINANTNKVEGLIIRGEEDFVLDIEAGCKRVTRCSDFDCKGESVQKIHKLPLKSIFN